MKRNRMVVFILLWAIPLVCHAFELKTEYDVLIEEAVEQDDPGVIDPEKFNFEKTPINKLGRGIINLTTCWTEMFADFFTVSEEKDPIAGSTIGIAQGTVTSIYRGVTALYDIVTFPFGPYDRPPMKPEYALNHADSVYNYWQAKSRIFGGE